MCILRFVFPQGARKEVYNMKKRLSILTALLLIFAVTVCVLPAFPAAVSAEEPPSAVDLTLTEHLPPIGNQGEVGSCASMAITYMQFTNAVSRYMHSVDPDTEWNPSSGDPKYCFSPRFTYNLAGAGTAWVYEIIKEQGCPTQEFAPYSGGPTGRAFNNVLAKDWAARDDVWSDAQYYRITNYDQVVLRNVCGSEYAVTTTDAGQALIERIKQSLRDGNVVVTGGNPDRWTKELVTVEDPGTYGKEGDFVIPYSSGPAAGGHQVAFVGYDDDITCVKNGVTLKGAFKIANSWGTGWYNDGFLWMMYDAFNGAGQSEYPALNVEDRIWTMDQVVFLDWRTDLLIGQPTGYEAEVTLAGCDRDGFTLTLTATHRANGSVVTYTPYMFNYMTRRPNYNGEALTFNGKSSDTFSEGTIALSYDELIKKIPAGRSIDEYDLGVRIKGSKDGVTTTVKRTELRRGGTVLYVAGGIDEDVTFNKTKNFTFAPEQSGVFANGGWTFAGGVLTVYGSGEMPGYRDDPSARPWAGFASSITKVVIDGGITSVGSCAFTHCDALTEVVCGADVTKICYDAFSYDRALTAIVFKGPISRIEQGTVYGSSHLTSVTVCGQTPAQFLEISAKTSYNTNYENAVITQAEPIGAPVRVSGDWDGGTWTLENYVLTISGSGPMTDFSAALEAPWSPYSEDIRKVVIEDGITSVGRRAFSQMKDLMSVVCGADVSSIGMDAFSYTPVNDITFFGRIVSIGQGTVYGCDCLNTVALTGQTQNAFLEIAHARAYNDKYDNAFFTRAGGDGNEPLSSTVVTRFGNGMENWANSPNKGDFPAATQILFRPAEWDADYYTPGMEVTVRMKALDGSTDDTFTTTVQTVYNGRTWGICRIEPCLMDTPWIPVKNVHYIATFSFVDREGLCAVCTVDEEYFLNEDPYVPAKPNPYDVNGYGGVTVADLTYLLNLLTSANGVCKDVNGDGIMSISDVTALLNYLAEH